MQLKLVDAIKEAGNVKRFLPSEFGMDPSKMEHALAPGRETFDQKMIVRKAIEDANIPFTYVSANCFAGYFVGSLSQLDTLIPPKDKVRIYGDGNAKVVYMEGDDIATYAIKAIDDPRTLNTTLYTRPPENILSQGQLVEIWEKLSGKKLEKIYIPGEDFLASMKGMDYVAQAGMGHFYHIFYEGCLTNFEIGEDGEEASNLYPEE
uniref:NmrA-like domain-containing protein n=1 Tax=Salix viminalis TaxID=40686 RepID=A0A6N2JZ67_SALVM